MSASIGRLNEAAAEIIDSGVQPNFIFAGGGRSHAAALNAFALFAQNEGVELRGIVLCLNDSGGKRGIQKSDIPSLNWDVCRIVREQNSGLLNYALTHLRGCRSFKRARKSVDELPMPSRQAFLFSTEFFYVLFPETGCPPISTLDFALRQEKPILFASLEEGLGTYTMSQEEWRAISLERQSSLFGKMMSWSAMHLRRPAEDAIQEVLDNRCTRYGFTLFEKSDGVLVPNSEACRYYARSYANIAHANNVAGMDYSDTAIIALTKFEAFDACELEILVLRETIGRLRATGWNVILKPHPGTKDLSRYEGLDASLDSHGYLTLETLVSASDGKPPLILGFMSSSQVFSNLLWGIPCISLYSAFRDDFLEESARNPALHQFIRETDRTTRLFSEYVQVPKSIEGLDDAIRDIYVRE